MSAFPPLRTVRSRPIAGIALNEQMHEVAHGNYNGEPADRRLVAVGAALGGLAVMLGAFGAHALKGRIEADALTGEALKVNGSEGR